MKKGLTVWIACFLIASVAVSQTCQPLLPLTYVNSDYKLPSGHIITVKAGSNLQSAIDQAIPGDIIEIQAGITFTGNYILRKKNGSEWIYIRSSKENGLPLPGIRVTPADTLNMARILSAGMVPAFTTEMGASNYRLIGLEISLPKNASDQYNLVNFGNGTETNLSDLPSNMIIDRCYIHGNNNGNLKVGVALNCRNAAIIDSRIDNIHAESGVSTFESKTIACYNGAGPFKIVNNYLEASHITILFGGAKSSIVDLVPSDVEIRCNVMTKRATWNPADPAFAGKIWGVKNCFEIKSGQRMLIEGNIFENCWPSDPNVAGGPQSGFGIVLTTRDESGTMPWCVIQDLIFRNNVFRHMNAGFSFYGSEGKGEHRLLLKNNLFEDIGGNWGPNDKTGRLVQATTLDDLCFDHNTLLHTANNIAFAYGTIKNIQMTNNISQWYDGFQGLTYSGWEKNVFTGGKPAGFSNSNYFPAAISNVNFINYAGGDYRLANNSPYKNAATDGSDIGCNINNLNSILNSCNQITTESKEPDWLSEPFILYPNPSKGIFTIETKEITNYTLYMYDILGRGIDLKVSKEGHHARIELKDGKPGIYFLNIISKNKQIHSYKIYVE